MRAFQEKGRWRKLIQSWPVLMFLSILLLFFAWSVFGFWGKMEETKKNKEIAKEKVAELEEKKENLSGDLEKLRTEEGIEESIREKFGWAKEGEGLIVVVEEKGKVEEEKPKSGGFFSWFKNLFR